MTNTIENGVELFSRGSEWRQWDLHVHTPASFHWEGKRFTSPNIDTPEDISLIDEMIGALNAAKPAVFALMDYWTFDGWFALKKRLSQPGAPKLLKKIFPGIELRLVAPTSCRLNAHVIFSDEIDNQSLLDFKSKLEVAIVDRPLSNEALVNLARTVGSDFLTKVGHTKNVVDSDEANALLAGSKIAEIKYESYKKAINSVPDNKAIGLMPFDTSDGLAAVKWEEHYAYFLDLFSTSPIFETRKAVLRDAFVGLRTSENTSFFDDFQRGLKGIPRLAVSGSDAHRFTGTPGNNDKRGYGDFPSGKITWIKADPTFLGLLQAIKEPAKRSFIGDAPDKLKQIAANKTYYINRVTVEKNSDSTLPEVWLDKCDIPLNPELVAVIGNKGSGKSALADIIALLGNSEQSEYFTFLKKDRFRGKTGEPAKQFKGTIHWLDGTTNSHVLSENPDDIMVNMVRYIPQGYFEELCNSHVSGDNDAFENELRSVIFSHTDASVRMGALDFSQLIQNQERSLRDKLTELRKELKTLNQDISNLEEQIEPGVHAKLQETLNLKRAQIEEHEKIKPELMVKPADGLTPEQVQTNLEIENISAELKKIETAKAEKEESLAESAKKQKAISNVQERIGLIERSYAKFKEDIVEDAKLLNIDSDSLVKLTVSKTALHDLERTLSTTEAELKTSVDALIVSKNAELQKQILLAGKLGAIQAQYQKSQSDLQEWETKKISLIGTPDIADTQKGIEAKIEQILAIPAQLQKLRDKRISLCGEIYEALNSQRESREKLFEPVQRVIKNNPLLQDDYKLEFSATFGLHAKSLTEEIFTIIKPSAGGFKNADENYAIIQGLLDTHDINSKAGAIDFVSELISLAIREVDAERKIFALYPSLRKDKRAADFYDLVFGLEFLDPRYSLLFQETNIGQLSPGQRGALLLIFYLLVDKGQNPIILDQPEENLDNQTIAKLLVPVIGQAKKNRQIIMVTHNPNLAVVCDAEQIVYSKFDRSNKSTITYDCGSIERGTTNNHVVNVLEGTKVAFDNRKDKYH